MDTNMLVSEEISGYSAKTYVSEITKFHRIQGSVMFHDSAIWVRNEMLRLGLADAEILQFPADGKAKFWTHESSVGWNVRSAELRLVQPKEELLARFEDVPQSLHTFSQSTPKDGVMAEIVDVGKGMSAKDYQSRKVRGKIVLATGSARQVHQLAVVERGAAGVITDTLAYEFPDVRESLDIPDAHSYQGIWPTGKNMKKIRFGFSLSKRQGNELRAILNKGKRVRLNARVDAELFPGKYDVVTASIRGASLPEQEVFLIAHLCHPKPGANDNASGSGLLMEIARTMMSLIRSGRMQRPARTIRFIWVPETTGTVAMLSTHARFREKLLAGINLDMVGEDQDICRSTLNFCPTPDSLPSYLNDFVMSVLDESNAVLDKMVKHGLLSTFRYAQTPFATGSDHAEFVEPTTGVPCISFTQWPDKFYHTSMDTIDKVSEDSLKRVGWVSTVAALRIANADAITAFELAALTSSKGLARLAQATAKASGEMYRKARDPGAKTIGAELARLLLYHQMRIDHISCREREAVKSTKVFGKSQELDAFVAQQMHHLRDAAEREKTRIGMIADEIARQTGKRIQTRPKESASERQSRNLVPRRKFKGTLGWTVLRDHLGERGYEPYMAFEESDHEFWQKTAETVNYIDGQRTVHEIVAHISAEYSPTDHAHILHFLRDLEKMNLITFR